MSYVRACIVSVLHISQDTKVNSWNLCVFIPFFICCCCVQSLSPRIRLHTMYIKASRYQFRAMQQSIGSEKNWKCFSPRSEVGTKRKMKHITVTFTIPCPQPTHTNNIGQSQIESHRKTKMKRRRDESEKCHSLSSLCHNRNLLLLLLLAMSAMDVTRMIGQLCILFIGNCATIAPDFLHVFNTSCPLSTACDM